MFKAFYLGRRIADGVGGGGETLNRRVFFFVSFSANFSYRRFLSASFKIKLGEKFKSQIEVGFRLSSRHARVYNKHLCRLIIIIFK